VQGFVECSLVLTNQFNRKQFAKSLYKVKVRNT